MTGRLFNMKSLILSGVFLFFAVCDSARANYDWSKCDANGNVNIQNISLKGGQYLQGQELQKITVPISYTCTTTWSSFNSLVYSTAVSLSDMRQVATALKDRGLGMDIVVQEGSLTPVTFTWRDIQAGFSGCIPVQKHSGNVWTRKKHITGAERLQYIFLSNRFSIIIFWT